MRILDHIEDMLCDELEDIVKKKELTSNSLEIIDTSVDVIKDIHTIKAMEQEYPSDDGYSQGYYGRMPIYMYDNGMTGSSYANGTTGSSYARGRSSNTSRGRYNYNGYSGDTKDELQRLMDTAKDERDREAIRNALDRLR